MNFFLKKTNLESLKRESGIPSQVFSRAKAVMTVNDFLENPPPDARGSYALGLTSHGQSGIKGIYFHLASALNLIDWPSAYAKAFGRKWSNQINDPRITDKFLDHITNDDKNIIFFIPDNILEDRKERTYTQEEIHYFLRNSDKLSRVIFVLGAYNLVDPEDYEKISGTRNQQMRKDYINYILKNPKEFPKDPVADI
jgi:hypothetical protein